MCHVEAIIVGVLVVAWIAYLVPWFVMRRHDRAEESEEATEFPDTMSVVRDGGLTISAHTAEPQDDLEVATPFTRAHARQEVREAWANAAVRRRRTVAVLMLLTTLMAVLALTSVLSWWFTAAAGALVVAFFVVARISVVRMARRLDAQIDQIDRGWDEHTVLLSREAPFPEEFHQHESDHTLEENEPTAYSVELNGPVSAGSGSLWDAVPVTTPTYVSKPIAARTVRTIDLSAPGPVAGQTSTPVTAEHPQAVGAHLPTVVEGSTVEQQPEEALRRRSA